MKLALALLALVSVDAYAVDRNSSWEKIYEAGLSAQFPQVNFSVPESGNAVFISVDAVCVAGEMMRTIAPVTVCVEYSAANEEYTCVRTEDRVLETARSFKKLVPGSEGTPDIIYDFTYPLSYEIPVGRDMEHGFDELFTKAFTIQSCN